MVRAPPKKTSSLDSDTFLPAERLDTCTTASIFFSLPGLLPYAPVPPATNLTLPPPYFSTICFSSSTDEGRCHLGPLAGTKQILFSVNSFPLSSAGKSGSEASEYGAKSSDEKVGTVRQPSFARPLSFFLLPSLQNVLKPSRMGLYPVQRQRFPCRMSSMSRGSRDLSFLFLRAVLMDITIPVEKQQWISKSNNSFGKGHNNNSNRYNT